MDISVSLSRLDDSLDEQTEFLKQIGVDHVDVYPSAIPEFQSLPNLKNVAMVVKKIKEAGISPLSIPIDLLEAMMGKPEGERQIENSSELIEFAGKEGIPLIRIWPQGPRQGPGMTPGRYRRAHRGGYLMDAFSLELMRREMVKRDMSARWAHQFREKLTPEDYFSNSVRFLQRLAPIAEEADVRLMMHFDDPPVPDSEGLLPGFTNPLMINRLLEAVPSRNVGVDFCCGTRYESGVDIFEQILILGRRSKIFHIHFRNVRGTIPTAGGYEEVSLDDRDMDMFRVLRALKDVGYDGALNPDHLPILIGDEGWRASLAFAVGYIKALISALS